MRPASDKYRNILALADDDDLDHPPERCGRVRPEVWDLLAAERLRTDRQREQEAAC